MMPQDAEYHREYRERNRAKRNAYMRAWRAKRKAVMTDEERERKNAYQREWTRKNPEKARAAKARYRANNPEKVSATKADWQRRNRERCNAYKRAWYARQAPTTARDYGPGLAACLALDPLYAAASAAVPRHLPADIRDDVISAMVIAMLEGEDVTNRSREFIADHFRERDWSMLVSINSPVGDTTLGAIIGAY